MIKKIVLIGAGNVATHLGSALCGAGCDVVQVYSRTKESAMELADKLSAEYTVSVDGIRCDADMYIVALKDSALQECSYVGERQGTGFLCTYGGQYAYGHLEGIFIPLREFFYPMQTLVNSVL